MAFLVPLYLAGALAVAIPIYLHLRRRPPKDAVEFSSLMFLEPTRHQPIKRQSQLENIPLLLLRCLALLLLAAMFARPFLRGGDAELEEGKMRTVILIDTSASMQREGVWEDAVAAAEGVIERMQPEGALALVAVDRIPRTLAGFDDWNSAEVHQRQELARQVLADLEPGWSHSDLGSGLIAAAEMVADATADEEAPRPARIVVVSDLQAGAALDAVADASWPSNLAVDLLPLEPDQETNVALALAPSSDEARPAIRLRNDPSSESSRFTLRAGSEVIEAVVPPGESRVVQLGQAAPEVRVSGDQHDFDNRLFLAPREPAPLTLCFLGEGQPDDSNGLEYYFRRAFGFSEVLAPTFVDTLEDQPAILAIGRALDQDEQSKVRRFLEVGGDALLVVSNPSMAKTLAALSDLPDDLQLDEHRGRYALLERIDFDHPALREFRDPRWRDFTDVHFWHHRILDPGILPAEAQIVARFDSGHPAWLHLPVGSGSLFVMLSGWHPEDSQLSLSSKFLPLLFSLFSERGPQVTTPRQFFVGDPLPLEESEQSITLPSGRSESRDAGTPYRPAEPGLYRVSDGTRSRTFAVNLRPTESELTPLGREPLAALGVPVERPASAPVDADGRRTLRDQEAEARHPLWRWAVVILLTMLVVEAWLATRTSQAQPQPEGAVS